VLGLPRINPRHSTKDSADDVDDDNAVLSNQGERMQSRYVEAMRKKSLGQSWVGWCGEEVTLECVCGAREEN
jgi:hypothetical protein